MSLVAMNLAPSPAPRCAGTPQPSLPPASAPALQLLASPVAHRPVRVSCMALSSSDQPLLSQPLPPALALLVLKHFLRSCVYPAAFQVLRQLAQGGVASWCVQQLAACHLGLQHPCPRRAFVSPTGAKSLPVQLLAPTARAWQGR